MPSRTPPPLNEMQKRIGDLLARSVRPMSAYDVIEGMRGMVRLSPPTVYRALRKLVDEGLVHRLETQNAYVACHRRQADCGHGHGAGFMICRNCRKTQEFDDAEVELSLARTTASSGFAAERIAVEIEGLCADCAKGG